MGGPEEDSTRRKQVLGSTHTAIVRAIVRFHTDGLRGELFGAGPIALAFIVIT